VAAGAPPQPTSPPVAASPALPESTQRRAEDAIVRPNTLTDETRLLVEADQALRSGNASRALFLLDAHAASYPESSFAPERSAERILALCALGRVDAATVRGYLAARPTLFSARIRETCSSVFSKSR
jgi:RNA polymerase sigma-70 factor (ECF subfamily)